MILLIVSLFLMIFTVFFLRISAQSGSGNGVNGFGLFTLILLALVAVCVYRFVRS
jgi:hypothetical protein